MKRRLNLLGRKKKQHKWIASPFVDYSISTTFKVKLIIVLGFITAIWSVYFLGYVTGHHKGVSRSIELISNYCTNGEVEKWENGSE